MTRQEITEKMKSEKRYRIINAAVKIFARKGLHKGKIADIAREAQIGKGTVYEYFKSKEDIFNAIVLFFFEHMNNDIQQLMKQDIPSLEKLRLFIEFTFDFFDEKHLENQEQYWTILIEILSQSFKELTYSPPETIKQSDTVLAKLVWTMISDLFTPLIKDIMNEEAVKQYDPQTLSFILFGSLDGLAIHYYLNRDHLDRERLKEATIDVFLNGIINPKHRKGNTP